MLQKEQVARQNGEIEMLRETMHNLLESQAASTSPESIPQSTVNESLTAPTAMFEDACLDMAARDRESTKTLEDENSRQKGLLIASRSQRDITLSDFVEQKEETHSDADSGCSAYSF